MTMTAVRPRWATFSVKSHLDLDALTLDVLLYDALVFPTPYDTEEVKRWDAEKWDPTRLALRITQLGDLAYMTPWTSDMQILWQEEFERRKAERPDDPELAFSTTADILATQHFTNLVGPGDDRLKDLPEPPKLFAAVEDRNVRKHTQGYAAELVAAYQDPEQARRRHRILSPDDPRGADRPWDTGLALRFEAAAPEVGDDEGVFDAAVQLAHDKDFRIARRRLWAWEQDRKDYDAKDIAFALEQLVTKYNEEVQRSFARTRKRAILYVVPLALGVALDLTTSGVTGTVAGLGLNISVDVVKAKFPELSKEAEPLSHHPGSAVARALAVLAHK
jgi:hypothetical protein